MANAVARATTQKHARRLLSNVSRHYRKSDAVADALFVPMILGEMAGQLMVFTYEAPESAPVKYAFADVGDAQAGNAFLGKPWQAALQEFERRGLVRPDELSRLLTEYAQKTDAARKLLLEQVQKRVYAELTEAIEQGNTFAEFADAIRADAVPLGIDASDSHYLQTVFRTNVLDAYGRGRHRALSHPDVVEARPFRQIRTAGDARVRDEHDDLDNLVFRADGPLADTHPPFGFNCRCSIVSLESWDGEVVETLPDGAVAPGFG